MAVTLYHPYITLLSVKQYCGENTAAYDDDFNFGINRATKTIEGLSGRNFYQTTLTDEYISVSGRGNGWRVIDNMIFTPKLLPIISISSLHEDGTLLVENTDYYINKNSGEIEKVGTWNTNPRTIKITGLIGYASANTATRSDDLPREISAIALELAARFSGRFNKRKISHITGEAANVDIYEMPKWIVTDLKAMREKAI